MAFPRLGATGLPLNLEGAVGSQLPFPNTAFPAGFTPGISPTNLLTLEAGQIFLPPAGSFLCIPGPYTSIQFLDPVTTKWTTVNAAASYRPIHLNTDGTNVRLANLTGLPIGALITNAGTGYTNGIGSAATGLTITPSAGGSTWVPVVGGAVTSTTQVAGGSSYTFPPIVVFSAPPAGGIQASGFANLTTGAVSSITVTNPGAGYVTAPNISFFNDWRDITGSGAAFTSTLGSSGILTAMYPTGNVQGVAGYGSPQTAIVTFTFSPASTTAATAVMCWVVTGLTVTGGGVAVPAGSAGQCAPTVTLGTRAAGVAGPIDDINLLFPRAAWIQLNISGGVIQSTGNTVVDAGLFEAAPTFGLVNSTGVAPTTGVNITPTVGGITDTSYLQPY
jgi:hypothetical protein